MPKKNYKIYIHKNILFKRNKCIIYKKNIKGKVFKIYYKIFEAYVFLEVSL